VSLYFCDATIGARREVRFLCQAFAQAYPKEFSFIENKGWFVTEFAITTTPRIFEQLRKLAEAR
jgi:hypothetical protein